MVGVVTFLAIKLASMLGGIVGRVVTTHSILSIGVVRKLEHWSHFSLIPPLRTLSSFYLSL